MRIDGADPCNSAQSLTAFLRQERFVSSKKFSSDNPVCPSAARNRMHVAIPMYNLDESTLKEAITSVKTQNYPREKVTVWLYDDGSTRHDSMQTLHNTCDEVFYFAVPPDAIADDEGSWESVYVALDQMGLSNVRNNPRGGQVLCFRADRHLGAGGGKYWLMWLIRASSNQNDVVTILDGDDTLLGERALEIINQKYIDTSSWFTYGSYEGRWSEQIVDLPESIRDKTDEFQPRDQPWLYGHPRSFKAHLLGFLSADDFKFSDGSWLVKGTDRGFVYRMLELSGPDRIGYISDKIYQYNFSPETSTLASVSKQVRDAQISFTMIGMAASEPLMPDVHVVLLVWKRAYLLKQQLEWLEVQKGLGGRRIHLHLVNNNPTALEHVEEAVEQFRYASQGLTVGDEDSSNELPQMKVTIRHNSGTMHHNFARFVYVDELRTIEQLDEVIFLDDDQFWPRDFLSSLLKAHRPKSMTTW
jgi:cellulose synthase/poly-beta-1,6-N-acetylglucosamine synthase-like glycosyltransferase